MSYKEYTPPTSFLSLHEHIIILGGLVVRSSGYGAIEMEVGIALDLVVVDDFHGEGVGSCLRK